MIKSHLRLGLLLPLVALALVLLALGPVQAGEQKTTDPAQVGRGAKAWVDNCTRCHNMRAPGDFEDYEWDVIVNHMRVRANLPGDIARDVKAFLKASN